MICSGPSKEVVKLLNKWFLADFKKRYGDQYLKKKEKDDLAQRKN